MSVALCLLNRFWHCCLLDKVNEQNKKCQRENLKKKKKKRVLLLCLSDKVNEH